jgi:hypothetical protein
VTVAAYSPEELSAALAAAELDAAEEAADRQRARQHDAATAGSKYASENAHKYLERISGFSSVAAEYNRDKLVVAARGSLLTGGDTAAVYLDNDSRLDLKALESLAFRSMGEGARCRVDPSDFGATRATRAPETYFNDDAAADGGAWTRSGTSFRANYVGADPSKVAKKVDLARAIGDIKNQNQGRREVKDRDAVQCLEDMFAGLDSKHEPHLESKTPYHHWRVDERVCLSLVEQGMLHDDHRDALILNNKEGFCTRYVPIGVVTYVKYYRLVNGYLKEVPDVDLKRVPGIRFRVLPAKGHKHERFTIQPPHGGFWAACARANAFYTHGVCQDAADEEGAEPLYRMTAIYTIYSKAPRDD